MALWNNTGMAGVKMLRLMVLCGLVILFDGMDIFLIGLTAPSIAAFLNVSPAALGPVFSISQAGIMVGALLFGPAADRMGRRRLVIFTTALFAAFTLATVLIGSLNQLLLCRFLTGLGLGGATPSAVALAAERAPERTRSAFVAIVWAALPLGGALAGVASSLLQGPFGWRALFYLGGIAPLVLVGALFLVLPHSSSDEHATRAGGIPVRQLFAEGRAAGTFLLWYLYFASFLILVTTTSWTPTLLRGAGISTSLAGLAITLHSLGSVAGSAVIGHLMDRRGVRQILGPAFLLNAAAGTVLGFVASDFVLVGVFMTFAGACAGACQSGSIALSARFYPAEIRSTGVGWASAAGRLGAAAGPLAGGVLLGRSWPVQQIFLALLAVPALLGAACVGALRWRAAQSLRDI